MIESYKFACDKPYLFRYYDHQHTKYLQFNWLMNTKHFAYLKAAYFSSNLIGCQLKITLILTAAPPLFCRSLLLTSQLTSGVECFWSRIFCTLMINMLLSNHSKNMAYFSRFSNFL